jgi:hypothetical protein
VTLRDVVQNQKLVFAKKKGEVLYRKEVNTGSSFKETFVLNELKSGDYTLRIESDFKTQVIPVYYKNGFVKVDLEASDYRFFPVIIEKDDLITVSVVSEEQNSLNITITDQFDNVVYEETLRGAHYLGKQFDFSKVRGSYKMRLETDGLVTERRITKY